MLLSPSNCITSTSIPLFLPFYSPSLFPSLIPFLYTSPLAFLHSSLLTLLIPMYPLSGVEMFKKSMDFGQAGDNIGALLRGVKRDDVIRGQVLAQPNTVKTYKKFEVHLMPRTYFTSISINAKACRKCPFLSIR